MDRDWNDVKAFSEVAQAGSLTEAARRSGISIATLSRRLEQIERTMGLQLVRRSPAGAELTEDGKALLPAVQEAHEAMDTVLRLSRALKDGETTLPVRISATETVITTLLAPALKGLEGKRGRPAVDFVVSTENADLSKREAEMAIRLAAPALDTLHARRLGTVVSSLYAAPAYPAVGSEDAQAFLSQDFVLYDERFGDIPEVIWARNQGIANRAVMLSSSTLAMLEAVKSGAGIGLLPDYLAARHGLVRVDCPVPPPRPLWLVYHRDLRNDQRVRVVREWVADAVRQGVRGSHAVGSP